MQKISERLLSVINTLPLKQGMRVFEIGCGSGVAAIAIAERFDHIFILAIDRSAKAIAQACKNAAKEKVNEKLMFLRSTIESFELPPGQEKFDMAFAVRVGALDGRHPETEQQALQKIWKVLKKNGRLFIEKNGILQEVKPQLP